jgi:hypothetical protein
MSTDRGDIMIGAAPCAAFLSELLGEEVPQHLVYRYIDRGVIPGGRGAGAPGIARAVIITSRSAIRDHLAKIASQLTKPAEKAAA